MPGVSSRHRDRSAVHATPKSREPREPRDPTEPPTQRQAAPKSVVRAFARAHASRPLVYVPRPPSATHHLGDRTHEVEKKLAQGLITKLLSGSSSSVVCVFVDVCVVCVRERQKIATNLGSPAMALASITSWSVRSVVGGGKDRRCAISLIVLACHLAVAAGAAPSGDPTHRYLVACVAVSCDPACFAMPTAPAPRLPVPRSAKRGRGVLWAGAEQRRRGWWAHARGGRACTRA